DALSPSGTVGTVTVITNTADPFVVDCGSNCSGLTNYIAGQLGVTHNNLGGGGAVVLGNESGPTIITNFSQAVRLSTSGVTAGSITIIGTIVQVSGVDQQNGVSTLDVSGKGTATKPTNGG